MTSNWVALAATLCVSLGVAAGCVDRSGLADARCTEGDEPPAENLRCEGGYWVETGTPGDVSELGDGTDGGDADAQSGVCGNGTVEGDEACDDGNRDDGDGCSSECTVEEGWECATESSDGPSECQPVCGDGAIVGGEMCDDGNTSSGDGCSSSCTVEEGWDCTGDAPSRCSTICGDGIVAGSEGCDDGGTEPGDGCSETCEVEEGWSCDGEMPSECTPVCGDGTIAGDEVCDDGNTEDGDGCSSDCTVEEGWTCDEAEPSTCQATECGDGFVAGDEECDDGDTEDGDGCNSNCQVEEGYVCNDLTPNICSVECGDGKIIEDEVCDDGNSDGGDGCSATCESVEPGWECSGEPSQCVAEECGDGIVAGDEECDDGNDTKGDGCHKCELEPGFGDGHDDIETVESERTFNSVGANAEGTQGSDELELDNRNGQFETDQKVFLHQTQAASGSVGHFEYARVDEVRQSGSLLKLEESLDHTYRDEGSDSDTHAQVVVVPEYKKLVVDDGTVTAPAWDGAKGGLLVVDVLGDLVVDGGTIEMSGRGFQGRNHASECSYQCGGTTDAALSYQGESHRGTGTESETPNASGGGGGMAGPDDAGGGGGGHGADGNAGDDGVDRCSTDQCRTSCPVPGGEAGEVAPDDLTDTILFGGAGGEGGADEDGAYPGAGGDGGGIVVLRAARIETKSSVAADGRDGERGSNDDDCGDSDGCGMGGGGGGAGGAIRLQAGDEIKLGGDKVHALGGEGAESTCDEGDFGGDGAEGRIATEAPKVDGNSDPPAN